MSNSPVTQHQRQEARHDQVLDRVDAEHLERVELLADLAGAEVGGDRGAGHAGQHDRVDERRELPDRREHEEPAEPVQRAEQHQEVRRLQSRRLVAERDRRDQQREPAQLHREQELADELAPYGYGGRTAETIVLPVRIIMFPTSSSTLLVGKNVFSAAARTISRNPPVLLHTADAVQRLTAYWTTSEKHNFEPARNTGSTNRRAAPGAGGMLRPRRARTDET